MIKRRLWPNATSLTSASLVQTLLRQFFFCLCSEDKDTKVDWFVFMLRCLSFSVCSIRIERKVSPDLIYEILSNMNFTSTRQDKQKCSKATLRVRSWKTRLEAM